MPACDHPEGAKETGHKADNLSATATIGADQATTDNGASGHGPSGQGPSGQGPTDDGKTGHRPIDVDTALARTRDVALVVGQAEDLPLTQAVGRFLARDITAQADLPPFDNAAMDGFALRHADLARLGAEGLPLRDSWLAGSNPTPLALGHAARIMTGAPLPAGADCVIRQEDIALSPHNDRTAAQGSTTVQTDGAAPKVGTSHQVDGTASKGGSSYNDERTAPNPAATYQAESTSPPTAAQVIRWRMPLAPAPFHNIRRKGEDLAKGETVLRGGQMLTPERLGLLAGAGLATVPVWRRVRVGLFSTGDELVTAGGALGAGQIYNSNRVMISAALALPWITLTDYGILPDQEEAIAQGLARAEAECDVIITSGGMSVGAADHVLGGLARRGADLAVLKIAMRPGKPLAVARIGKALFIGLPGNPFAALVTFSQIALPVLRHVAGASEATDSLIAAVSGFDYPRNGQRREYLPVTWDSRDALGRPVLQMLGKGASARLSPPARAKGIAILPETLAHVQIGAPLLVAPLPR